MYRYSRDVERLHQNLQHLLAIRFRSMGRNRENDFEEIYEKKMLADVFLIFEQRSSLLKFSSGAIRSSL